MRNRALKGEREEKQGLKRIIRIGQNRPTQTIKFVNQDSLLDLAIYGWQGARRRMLQMVEAPMDYSDAEKLRNTAEESIEENQNEKEYNEE